MEHLKDFLKSNRTNYNLDNLTLDSSNPDPVIQFESWMKLAVEQKINEPNAMNLATASQNGRPSSRIVLLRSFDHEGFVFFTNYESSKSLDLLENPWCSLNFYWPELHRQVRIEGRASKVSERDSEEYFNSRPKESQIGALVSSQSRVLTSRSELDEKYENLTKQFATIQVKKPAWWGGFRIAPVLFEFWQGRPNRLHDRIRYTIQDDNSWSRELLYP